MGGRDGVCSRFGVIRGTLGLAPILLLSIRGGGIGASRVTALIAGPTSGAVCNVAFTRESYCLSSVQYATQPTSGSHKPGSIPRASCLARTRAAQRRNNPGS